MKLSHKRHSINNLILVIFSNVCIKIADSEDINMAGSIVKDLPLYAPVFSKESRLKEYISNNTTFPFAVAILQWLSITQ